MANKKLKNAFASFEVAEFDGIDRTKIIGDAKGAADIRNFRILPDGSLRKRCGYSLALSLPAGIRAIWSGDLGGSPALVALAGDTVYVADPGAGTYAAAGVVGTSAGGACFFYLGGGLFLVDGGDVYSCTRTSIAAVSGYVPLYGKDWLHTGGSVNEAVNQLSTHIRITYKLAAYAATSVPTGIEALSVDSLVIDGVLKTSGYSLSGKTLNLGQSCGVNSVIEVCLNIGSSYAERTTLGGCTGAAVYGGKYDTSVYCFGGSDRSRVFRSKYVSAADAAASAVKIPGSSGLYFPVGYDFSVASGGARVSAVCRHYDRLLLFSTDDARMTDLSEGGYQDIPVRPVNSGVGCLKADGVVLCGNDPVTVSRDGVYRWTANTDERDESSAVKISLPVEELFDREWREGAVAFNFREREEIWFGNTGDAEGRVFVYNWRSSKWYSFTGIYGERYFTYGGNIGFSSGGGIYIFREEEYTDCGSLITAEFRSRLTDMGKAGPKRLRRCQAVLSGGSEVTVELSDNGEALLSVDYNRNTLSRRKPGGGSGEPGFHEARVYTGRFDCIGYRITAGGEDRQRIYGITMIE